MKAAVLGFPIEHSLSPYLHLLLAQGCGVEMEYGKIPTEISALKTNVNSLIGENYIGFNCTMPLKTEMYSLCDTLSDEALFLHSVNTVKIRNGRLFGSTTDGKGMLTPAENTIGSVKGKTVLLLGTGGTARSIAYSFQNAGADIIVVNRSVGIMGEMFPNLSYYGFDKLNELSEKADIIINATPIGMNGFDEFPDLSFINDMKKGALVCDAVYNPVETSLLKTAKMHGLKTVDGLTMLVYQGVFSFFEWTGIMPNNQTIEKTYAILKGENK